MTGEMIPEEDLERRRRPAPPRRQLPPGWTQIVFVWPDLEDEDSFACSVPAIPRVGERVAIRERQPETGDIRLDTVLGVEWIVSARGARVRVLLESEG